MEKSHRSSGQAIGRSIKANVSPHFPPLLLTRLEPRYDVEVAQENLSWHIFALAFREAGTVFSLPFWIWRFPPAGRVFYTPDVTAEFESRAEMPLMAGGYRF